MTAGDEPVATGPGEPAAPDRDLSGDAAPAASDPAAGVGPGGDASNGSGRDPAVACAACGETLVDGARFCEACGAPAGGEPSGVAAAGGGSEGDLAPGGVPPGDVRPGAVPSGGGSADVPTLESPVVEPAEACARCEGEVGPDGYCTSCGHRAVEEIAVERRDGLAAATHRGRRHHRNEDAVALAVTAEGWPVLVVSDGVSVSPSPHEASAAAVAAAADVLDGRPFGGGDQLVAAVARANEAVSALPGDRDPHWTPDGASPACTLVVAVATPEAIHVANVGDARAHVVAPAGGGWSATQVSADDSVAAQAVAQGIDAEVALNLPGGHGITAWLGADAPELDPHVATHPAPPGGLLLLSSDGLWNYAATDGALSELLSAELPPPDATAAPTDLADPCRRLVAWAIDRGGADNITVALAALPAPAAGAAGPTQQEETP